LLDCEDELLTVADSVDIAYFLEATRAELQGPYDISLVEGSISTPEEEERIVKVRKQSRTLITIGACATSGGIQALRNFQQVDDFINTVYAHPEYIDTLQQSRPISAYVAVDFQLYGCPINKYQLLEVLNAALNRRKPNIPNYSQCIECKRTGSVCIMVTQGKPCLGPVVQAGCGNLCPSFQRGCYGCFGPKGGANTASLANWFSDSQQLQPRAVKDLFRGITAASEAFQEESLRHE
ncbi:MAG: oxidoreductase, partial [Chromatiales bacterium]|nr:oxidoreductase [Chromatiales bacterium]